VGARCAIWAVVQAKGGKSTLATSLAVAAEAHGERALILDLDPQGSSLLWGKTRGASKPPTVVDVGPERIDSIIDMARTLGATAVIIDTPSRLDNFIAAAVRIADMVLLPANPGLLALAPLRASVALIEAVGHRERAVAIVNNIDTISKAEAVGEVLADLEVAVAPTIISHLPAFGAAFDVGEGVTERKGRAGEQVARLWLDLDELHRKLTMTTTEREPAQRKSQSKTAAKKRR
jgi:chromosome partitioning protein